ncbi:MAG TPA: hypothetical protein VGQ26_09590 [Streptosporangiaceae bacterium]|jgi:hypothetical protein|nr:hypothetical protein [Streptosporangiaceae bacterium]
MATGPEGPRRTEDELRAALPMLERHAPSAEAVLRAVRDGSGRRVLGLVRRGAVPRRWPGWLAPVAAAAAVAGVIIASLAISGVILHHHAGTGPAGPSGVFAKVPQYFAALPEIPGRAVIGATATGAVLGTVTPPKPYTMFTQVAAAGDGRTFVFAAAPGVDRGPVRFYRLVLDRSGHPGRLASLPIPPETAALPGLALSPDGSKLAVSLPPVHGQVGSKIQVFSLATGARREWVWPGHGTISVGAGGGGSNSWEADNRTLLFQVTTRTRTGWAGQLRLLDTAAPAGSLLASSTRIPIPSNEVGWQHNNATHRIIGIPLITGDGTKLVAPFFHASAPPKVFGFTITEFSVRTGKPVRVLYQRRTRSEAAATGVWWVNTSGTAMIVNRGSVFGVQTPTTFTPLPSRAQRLFVRHGMFFRLPAW